jgi:hypothetical protein
MSNLGKIIDSPKTVNAVGYILAVLAIIELINIILQACGAI